MAQDPRDKPAPPSTSETLLIQLGTNPADLATEGVNMARLGIITDSDQVPESYRNWVYWDLRARLFGSRFARNVHDSGLDHTVGIGGRGRVDLIKGASVAQGGPVNTEAALIRTGWVVRNVFDKNWEERQRKELGLPQKSE